MTTELKGRPTMSSLREEQIKLLEMTQVTKTYQIGGQTVRALDSIDLTLHGGEFVSIVGPSGAGKSTLLHLLGALDRPDSGSIRFQGYARSPTSTTSSSPNSVGTVWDSSSSSSICFRR